MWSNYSFSYYLPSKSFCYHNMESTVFQFTSALLRCCCHGNQKALHTMQRDGLLQAPSIKSDFVGLSHSCCSFIPLFSPYWAPFNIDHFFPKQRKTPNDRRVSVYIYTGTSLYMLEADLFKCLHKDSNPIRKMEVWSRQDRAVPTDLCSKQYLC